MSVSFLCSSLYCCWGTERSWLEQGGVVGENVVPLARNFGSAELDIEADAILGTVIT